MNDYFRQNHIAVDKLNVGIHFMGIDLIVTDVATKIGKLIDEVAPQTNGVGERIGKGIDEITKDKTINIGKK